MGIFFGFACLAKVTAFVDIALFVVFFIGLLVSNISALGTGLIVIGCLRLLNILTASFMLSEGNARWLIGLGVLLVVIGVIISLLRKKKELSIRKSFIYLLVIGFRFLVPLLLFKAPRTVTRQIITSEFSVSNVIKGLLANTSSPANKLLADSGDQTELIEQTTIDW
ncbi:MAG: hypothetical protein LBI53_07805 [Candidatus Peribacteria bacterium]|nr:hypothetical protein [Candidatus Peribacteria bacterium]